MPTAPSRCARRRECLGRRSHRTASACRPIWPPWYP